jgi:DmX-like protein
MLFMSVDKRGYACPQELFIRAVFSKRRAASVGAGEGEARSSAAPHSRRDADLQSPVRIIHKEQDSIAAFCLNRVTPHPHAY